MAEVDDPERVCPNCNTSNPGSHQFCYRCGTALPEPSPSCPSCGTEITGESFVYCPRCGVPLHQVGQPLPAPYAAGPAGPATSGTPTSHPSVGYAPPRFQTGHDVSGPPPHAVRGRSPGRQRNRLLVIGGAAIAIVLVLLATIPLRVVSEPGSATPFSQAAQVESTPSGAVYVANLTFSAAQPLKVQIQWTTNLPESEALCAIAVAGTAVPSGSLLEEGSQFCTASYNFTSLGGTFGFGIAAGASFTVSGTVTIGAMTTKAPVI